MDSVTHVVQIYFDMDFPQLPEDEEWVRNRFDFFMKYTWKSLANQIFSKFRTFILCGRRFKALTRSLPWPDEVDLCYDSGRYRYEKEIDTPHVAITRLDSDDLFHRQALQDVADNFILSHKRECLIFRTAWTWDIANNLLLHRWRPSPPFYTHIFPRSIYKAWQQFSAEHFMGHGRAGGRLPETVELPEYRVCVIQHDDNVGLWRRGIQHERISDEKRKKMAAKHKKSISGREEIASILRSFGVTR